MNQYPMNAPMTCDWAFAKKVNKQNNTSLGKCNSSEKNEDGERPCESIMSEGMAAWCDLNSQGSKRRFHFKEDLQLELKRSFIFSRS